MNTIITFIFLIISNLSLASVRMDIRFNKKEIKQGSIESARIILDSSATQKIQLQKLKGQLLNDKLYVFDVSPLLRKDGKSEFEADAKLVFVKVPEGNILQAKAAENDITIHWENLKIIPTESQQFTYANFSVPSRWNLFVWFAVIVFVFLSSFGIRHIWLKIKVKKERRAKRRQLKDELLGVKHYEDIVSIWKRKTLYIENFPTIVEPFKKMETILYRYQFRQTQSEEEIRIVMEAYRQFSEEISGGLDGV